MSEVPSEVSATRSYWPMEGSDHPSATSFLIIEGIRSSLYCMPATGVVLIGRGTEADIQLEDELASRKHARLISANGQIRIVDLESHNGTFVNGERLDGGRVVESGDVIAIGAATLVLSAPSSAAPTRPLLDATQIRQRLHEELARAGQHQRPLTIALITLAHSPEDLPAAAERLGRSVRAIDVIGRTNSGQLLLLLPEIDDEAATPFLRAAVAALAAEQPLLLVASFPADGCDAETLLTAARAAMGAGDAAPVRRAREAPTRLTIGDRSIIVADPAMSRIYGLLERLAKTQLPVLILGESGAGKENAAYAVHAWSARASGPFITLNCAALQETLVESELFGYEKGAFSGAATAKPGLLERAHGGTVFLDELRELSLSAQAKLLRALEQKRITRLGDVREREVDIRLVGATNADLAADVAAGKFRQDLFFRLNGATAILPPLRARPREVPILARHFLAAACAQVGRAPLTFSPAALQQLAAHRWLGNVRELKHAVEYAAALADEETIEVWHLPDSIVAAPPAADPAPAELATPVRAAPAAGFRPVSEELRELERRRIVEALSACNGVQRRAADLISMPIRTFSLKLKQYGL